VALKRRPAINEPITDWETIDVCRDSASGRSPRATGAIRPGLPAVLNDLQAQEGYAYTCPMLHDELRVRVGRLRAVITRSNGTVHTVSEASSPPYAVHPSVSARAFNRARQVFTGQAPGFAAWLPPSETAGHGDPAVIPVEQ